MSARMVYAALMRTAKLRSRADVLTNGFPWR
jgi:hypothetical protein